MYQELNLPSEFADALEDYKSHLTEIFPVANTRRMYFSQVKQLINFAAEAGYSLNGLSTNPEQIVDSYLRRRELRPNTINHFLSATKHFLKHLRVETDLLNYRQEREVRQAKTLSQSDFEKLMRVVQSWPAKKARSILFLLMYAGLRISDLTALNKNDVISSEGRTYLFLKTSTMAGIVELPAVVAQALEAWMQERDRKFPHCQDKALFVNSAGMRISASGIDRLIRRVGHAAYLDISARKLKDTWKNHAGACVSAGSDSLQTTA